MFIPGAFNNTEGTLSLTGAFWFPHIGPPPITPPSGPGTLANVTFTVVGYGTSNITLGPETRYIGYDPGDPEIQPYSIIDAETMPDHIGHGFFTNKILGDVNGDRTVDVSDLTELSKTYGSKPGNPNWNPNCDFDCNGDVDAPDLFDLSKNYGKTV